MNRLQPGSQVLRVVGCRFRVAEGSLRGCSQAPTSATGSRTEQLLCSLEESHTSWGLGSRVCAPSHSPAVLLPAPPCCWRRNGPAQVSPRTAAQVSSVNSGRSFCAPAKANWVESHRFGSQCSLHQGAMSHPVCLHLRVLGTVRSVVLCQLHWLLSLVSVSHAAGPGPPFLLRAQGTFCLKTVSAP